MTVFWAALTGALTGGLAVAIVAWMTLKVQRHKRHIADLRKVADRYSMASPWWKRWHQPREEWDRSWS